MNGFPDESSKRHLRPIDLDHIEQINCFLKIDLGYSDKRLLKVPSTVAFQEYTLDKTSANRAAEYKDFIAKVSLYCQRAGLTIHSDQRGSFSDFYRMFASKPGTDLSIICNPK